VRVFLRFKVGNATMATLNTKAVKKEIVQDYLNSCLVKVRTLPDGTSKTRKLKPGNADRRTHDQEEGVWSLDAARRRKFRRVRELRFRVHLGSGWEARSR